MIRDVDREFRRHLHEASSSLERALELCVAVAKQASENSHGGFEIRRARNNAENLRKVVAHLKRMPRVVLAETDTPPKPAPKPRAEKPKQIIQEVDSGTEE